MKQKNSKGNKAEKPSGRTGTYGLAPLGYVELSGIREALQKATDEISRLEKQNETLRRRLKSSEPGKEQAKSRQGWDFSHLGETEQLIIRAYLKGEFRQSGLVETCRKLSRRHGKKASTYRKVFAKLRDYGVLSRLEPGDR